MLTFRALSSTVGANLLDWQPVVDRPSPDGTLPPDLTVEELEKIRESIRNSVDRTQAELERIEELIVAAKLREERRRPVEELSPRVGFETPTDAAIERRGMAQE